MREPIVVSTRSAHKLGEIRRIIEDEGGPSVIDLEAAGVACDPAEEEIEVYETFAENALAKARYFAAASGRPVLADDSGICVDALGGKPGVRSKRFSGRIDLDGAELDAANNALLLERMRDVPGAGRGAHFLCVAALVLPGGEEHLFEGRCDGTILEAERGRGGFGYDPLFRPDGFELSFAEIDSAMKNRVSHRARAIRALARWFAGEDRR